MCRQSGQSRGCLIGWVKVAAYLNRDATLYHVLPPRFFYLRACGHVLHVVDACTARVHVETRDRDCQERSGSKRKKERKGGRGVVLGNRASASFGDGIAPRYAAQRERVASVIGGFSLGRPRNMIPEVGPPETRV